MSVRTIALYGGTFDPVHEGHMALVDAARAYLHADLFHLIPCGISPHKTTEEPSAGPSHRLEMLRLAVKDRPWIGIDSRELEREGISYSFETADQFRERYPDDRLVWIMGADQWSALPTWKSPEHLARVVDFLVVGRSGMKLLPREWCRAEFLDMDHPASSSQIRARLRQRESVPEEWLSPRVSAYIEEHGLYQ